jgi:hypothetical protein
MAQGAALSRPWVLIAWVLLLAATAPRWASRPMHTWKPDAYGEAPGIVGAMLAGGVTTVAFTAILRVLAVVAAAGAGAMADRTLLAIGLFSMLVAALFLLGTRDFKRMLAYSSVEHMGILMLAAALGADRGVGRALPRVDQQPDQGRPVPQRGQHPPRRRARVPGRGARHVRPVTPTRRDLCGRPVRRHRLPALRTVLQRTAGPARRPGETHHGVTAGMFLVGCCSSPSSVDARGFWGRRRPSPPPPPASRASASAKRRA